MDTKIDQLQELETRTEKLLSLLKQRGEHSGVMMMLGFAMKELAAELEEWGVCTVKN
jgi:hypothetical protein